MSVLTDIVSHENVVVASSNDELEINQEAIIEQNLKIADPLLWSIEEPVMYRAVTRIMENGQERDVYITPFGIRYFEFTKDQGFFLNGERVPLKGVCLHHDLGPLGTAINSSALRFRLGLLKELGCNAIRTSHNPPSPQLLELSDEMGFLIIDEIFDEWKDGKMKNGYNTLWDDWAEKDLVAMIHRDRNHPSVIMWSIGNEIREQGQANGLTYCQFLVDICKREDPGRPTTAGFNQWENAIKNGLADAVDVVGWNYKLQYYNYIHKNHPEWKMYASEANSTVSSRGEYFFPAIEQRGLKRDPYQCSSFDMESPWWGRIPDREFAAQDSFPFMAGQFVWTGFDYLGEPTPYNTEWPARSSYFGLIDLCGIPKDRFYLFKSQWSGDETLHLLPHWNWENGQIVSVHSYTSFDKAELFLNGKSLGVKTKDSTQLFSAYRLIWDSIVFEPGELRIVALDQANNPLKESVVRTAGKPAKIKLSANRSTILADGNDLAFITVSVTDENGNICPRAGNLVHFNVEGSGVFKAVGNGDPTSLESFVQPYRKAFNGKCMLIIQSTEKSGSIIIRAESEGLKPDVLSIKTHH